MQPEVVVSGDYKGKPVGTNLTSSKVWITTKFSFKNDNKVYINADTVKKYEVLNESIDASGSTLKEMVLGTAAAVNSAKKTLLVSVEFKDGKKSLIQCSNNTYKVIQKTCFK